MCAKARTILTCWRMHGHLFIRSIAIGLAVSGCLMGVPVATAGTILASRSDLDALLNGAGVTEGFEKFDMDGLPQLNFFGNVLDSSTVVPDQGPGPVTSQGPGLIVNGVQFTSENALEILNLDFLGQSKVLTAGGTRPHSITIDFTSPVDAFGFDYFPTVLTKTDVTLTVYGVDDSTVLETDIFNVFFFLGNFFGISDSQGIGKVVVSSVATDPFNIYDTQIDNVTFGSALAVPEPAALGLLCAGLFAVGVIRGRRVNTKLLS